MTDAAHPAAVRRDGRRVIRDRDALERASPAGFAFAREQFAPHSVARRFSDVLANVTGLAARQRFAYHDANEAGAPSAIPVP